MLGSRWAQKPPAGTAIDRSHSLAQGLVFFAPLWDYGGGTVYDLVSGLALPITGATWDSGSTGGLKCNTTTSYAGIAPPAALQLAGPLTIAAGFRYLGAGTSNANYFGCYATNAAASAYFLGYQSGSLRFFFNGLNGGTGLSTAALATDQDYFGAGTYQSGAQAVWLNGTKQATASLAGAITYGTGPQFGFGALPAVARNPNILAYWGAVWSRVLSDAELARFGGDPGAIWRIFAPQRDVIRSYSTATGTGVSYPRGSSILRPVQLPTTDLTCYLD